MDFKEIIKKRRLDLNMSQERVAQLVGVGKSTVAKWERGSISNVTRTNIIKLANALQMPIEDLMGFDDNQSLIPVVLSDEERNLIEKYRSSSREVQDIVRRIVMHE